MDNEIADKRELPQPPLSDRELRECRELLERDKFTQRLWSSARTWALWIAAVVGAVTLGMEAIDRFINAFIHK